MQIIKNKTYYPIRGRNIFKKQTQNRIEKKTKYKCEGYVWLRIIKFPVESVINSLYQIRTITNYFDLSGEQNSRSSTR